MTASVEPPMPQRESASSSDLRAASKAAVEAGAGVVCEPPKRVPDFFIVGHQKCGTTALWEMLRRHPQIFMPRVKEPRYFAFDLRSRLREPRHRYRQSLDGYLSLFVDAGPEQLIGE